MLPFDNPLSNEDPAALAEQLAALRVWYIQLALIFSNLFFWPPIIVAYKFGRRALAAAYVYFFLGASIAVAMVISIFYHVCQTTGYCFLQTLVYWTIADHISAPSMMAMLVLFIVNPVTTKRMVQLSEKRLRRLVHSLRDNSGRQGLFDGDRMAAWHDARERKPRLRHDELTQAWSTSITYVYIFVIVLATLTHNFSMQAFIIAIAFGLAAVFFKLVVLEEGNPRDLSQRLSLPDLLVGLALIGLSLVFFVLDSYVLYWIMHSLWHALSGIGACFYIAGLSAHTPDFVSPCAVIYAGFRRIGRKRTAA